MDHFSMGVIIRLHTDLTRKIEVNSYTEHLSFSFYVYPVVIFQLSLGTKMNT